MTNIDREIENTLRSMTGEQLFKALDIVMAICSTKERESA